MKTVYLAAASMLAMSIAPAYAQDAAPAVEASGGLEDIVVTAQRREENLQRVPVAVTAMTAAALDNARITNVNNLSGYAPNVQITNQGQQSTPTIQIRGINSGTSDNAVDPKVGIYLDGVYIGRSVGAIFDLADLERVEMLRGPQGTLFGRNSTGGAISLISAAPTGEFGISQQLSYGNYNAFRSRTIVNLPQFGPLSLKVSYLHDQIDGDVDNLLGGRTMNFSQRQPAFGTLTYADKLGGRNVDAVQVAARIDASDNLKIDYRFDYTDSNTVGRAVQLLGATGDATGAAVGPILAAQAFTGGITNLGYKPMGAVANATSNEHVVTQGHNLAIAWDVDDVLTVKSITAYRKFKQDPNIYDLGSTGGLKVTTGPNDSFFTLLTSRSTSQKQFSQEMQFIFNWDSFDLTSGVFYFHENSPANNVLGIFETVINGTPANNGGVTATRAVNDSMAGYGQLTWHATDQIDVAFGARYTFDDRSTKLISVAPGAGSGLAPGQTYKTSYEKLNYTGILTYRPNDDITTYAKIATGYVAGGILGAIAYDPESLTSYEVGVKSKMLDNRVRANLAAFYSDYKDLQIQTFVGGVQRFENAGKARIWGVEAEFQAAPIDGLTIDANLGYTNFKYNEYMQGGVNVADQVNVTYTPKWTARVSGQYDFPEMSSGGNFFVNVDSRYRSSVPLTSFSTQIPALDALAVSKKYILTDARAGIASLPIAGTAIGISGWVKNVFNVDHTGFGPTAVNQVIIWDRGRTYGVDLSVKF